MFDFGSSSPAPAPPKLPDPLPTPPSYAVGAAAKPAGNANKVSGYGSTLLTSPMGVDESSTNTNKKSLLGQ